MKITIIKPNELCEVMQQLSLLKVKFGSKDAWIIAPILYAAEESTDIIINSENVNDLQVGTDVIFKFQRSGYEYIVSGKLAYIGEGNPSAASIRIIMAQRHINHRKHMRFDTNLNVMINISSEQAVESIATNLSRGGALLVSKADIVIGSLVSIQFTFSSQNRFTAVCKVLRKSCEGEDGFSYGVQFIDISEDDSKLFNREILKYEREYLKTLDILKEYTNKSNTGFDTKISILCYDSEESYDIRETLVKMGAENFDVFHNFSFHSEFFTEEKPEIVVVDADCPRSEIIDVVKKLSENFPQIRVILLLPLNALETGEKLPDISDKVVALYKPLILNEFKNEIIKYL